MEKEDVRIVGESITPEEIINVQMHMWIREWAPSLGGSLENRFGLQKIMGEKSLKEILDYRGQMNLSDTLARKSYEKCCGIAKRANRDSIAYDISKNRAYMEFLNLPKVL